MGSLFISTDSVGLIAPAAASLTFGSNAVAAKWVLHENVLVYPVLVYPGHDYFSFAYSALTCFSNGRLGSASFQRVRKSS